MGYMKSSMTTLIQPILEEHMFGTACSCRREVSINEFTICSNKLKIITKNIIQYDIKKGTSMECHMIGFAVFEPVV